MNDEQQPGALSDEDAARIRSLLAQARHDEPMPGDVVARLDRVLAGLAEEDLPPSAAVVRLADRRRRATRMLVAAAAVVVAGVGIGQLVGGHDSGTGSADSAAEAPAGASESAGERPEEQRGLVGADSGGAGALPQPQSRDLSGVAAYKVSPRHFARDTRRVQARLGDRLASYAASNDAGASDSPEGCVAGDWGAGSYVPVTYGRAPAYLVLRRAGGDSQVADLFLCGGTDPVRSITLPGP